MFNTVIINLAPAFPHPIPEVPSDIIANLAGTYVPPADVYKDWTGCKRYDYKPSERQMPVIHAVQLALHEKLFYTKDVLAYVIKTLAISDEVCAVGKGKVEGGNVGMDVYYARDFVEASATHKAELAACARMGLAVGKKLGALVLSDHKRNTGMTITAALEDKVTFTVEGKRGANVVRTTLSALAIMRAIDRAFDKEYRKDNATMIWPV